MESIFRRFLQVITNERPRWGCLRALLMLFIILGMVLWSSRAFATEGEYPWILISGAGWRFWIFPIAGFICALLVSAHYLRDLYNLPKTRQGLRYLLSVLFGGRLPVIKIEHGQMDLAPDEFNLLTKVGGPGYLYILPGNLVLMENQTSPSNVFAAGYHYVSRRETIKEIASLEDHHGHIEEAHATTKDGIEVIVRDIRYHYRLRPSRRGGEYFERSPIDPFPYSMQSIRALAYNRTVSQLGLTPLNMAMNFIIDGEISNYIYAHKFDDLTSPAWDRDPRKDIADNLRTKPEVRARLQDLGMELLWVDIGHFDVANPEVWNVRVKTWGAKWAGEARLRRELGQARRRAYHRLARAEGRADALLDMIQTLNQAQLQGQPPENLRRLIMLYTAQILEELSEPNLGPGQLSAGSTTAASAEDETA